MPFVVYIPTFANSIVSNFMSILATQLMDLVDQLQAFVDIGYSFVDEFDPTTLQLLERYTALSTTPSSLDLQRSSCSNT